MRIRMIRFGAMMAVLCLLLASCGCKHGDTVVKDKRKVTCTRDGYSGDTYCRECEKVIEKGEVLAARGHEAEDGVNAREATCTQAGYTGDIICASCGEVLEEGESLEAPGHTLEAVGNGVRATCQKEGYTGDEVCTLCGEYVMGKVLPRGPHAYQDNLCSDCGWMTPGLYQNDVLVMTWEDLKAGGYAIVQGGKLIDATGDYGGGKLVIGEDVNFISEGLKNLNASEVWLPASLAELDWYMASNAHIQKIVLFGNVTTIPENCFVPVFSNQDGLRCLVLPDTVRNLEYRAIAKRPYLTEFRFPASLEHIGREALAGCGLTDVVLPEGLKSIGLYAFDNSALRSIKLPASLESMDAMVFTYCADLHTVDMSACVNITELDYGMFRNCNSLSTLLLPPNLKSFSSQYNTFGADNYLPTLALKHLDLPEGFASFGAERFQNVKLTSVVWPASLVDGTALTNCPLQEIYYTGSEAQWNMVRGHDQFPNANIVFDYQRS